MATNRNGEYDVGYGKPPRNHQWRKGQSGNPKGRRKKSKRVPEDVLTQLRKAVFQPIPVTRNGVTTNEPWRDVFLEQLLRKAIDAPIPQHLKVVQFLLDLGVLEPSRKDFLPSEDALKAFLDGIAKKAQQ